MVSPTGGVLLLAPNIGLRALKESYSQALSHYQRLRAGSTPQDAGGERPSTPPARVRGQYAHLLTPRLVAVKHQKILVERARLECACLELRHRLAEISRTYFEKPEMLPEDEETGLALVAREMEHAKLVEQEWAEMLAIQKNFEERYKEVLQNGESLGVDTRPDARAEA